MEPRSLESPTTANALLSGEDANLRDEERALARGNRASSLHSGSDSPRPVALAPLSEDADQRTRASSIYSSTAYIRRQTSRLLEAIKPSAHHGDEPVPPKLLALIDAFGASEVHTALVAEIAEAAQAPVAQGHGTSELPDVAAESSLARGRKRASWGTQFRILSGRAFKNLYRDPALLAAHYVSAIVLARTYFSRA